MPELPDVELYLYALRRRLIGQTLEAIRFGNPFVLRTWQTPAEELAGRSVTAISRLGKRVVFELDGDYFIVVHLMIAGRFKWAKRGAKLTGKAAIAAFDFPDATLQLTEQGAKRRASIHLVQGREALGALDPGGIEPLSMSLDEFRSTLTSGRHTLKRALTDPRKFSGIGNAYSDEILHAAKLSPFQLTTNLGEDEVVQLYAAVQTTLREWTDRLVAETGEKFPERVTAFRPEMAVHGKYGQPCPTCATPVQRIAYAENEANYCPECQTGGKLLADRALSRLLRDDWPKTLEELEEFKNARRIGSS